MRPGVPRPVELREDQVLGRHDGELVPLDGRPAPPPELLAPVLAVLAHDQIHLHHVRTVNHVEDASRSDRLVHRVPVEVEVPLEEGADPIGLAGRQLYHDVDVPRHARHRIVVRRDRPRHHVCEAGGLEPPGDDREDLQLLEHLDPVSATGPGQEGPPHGRLSPGPLQPQLRPHPAEAVRGPASQPLAGDWIGEKHCARSADLGPL